MSASPSGHCRWQMTRREPSEYAISSVVANRIAGSPHSAAPSQMPAMARMQLALRPRARRRIGCTIAEYLQRSAAQHDSTQFVERIRPEDVMSPHLLACPLHSLRSFPAARAIAKGLSAPFGTFNPSAGSTRHDKTRHEEETYCECM